MVDLIVIRLLYDLATFVLAGSEEILNWNVVFWLNFDWHFLVIKSIFHQCSFAFAGRLVYDILHWWTSLILRYLLRLFLIAFNQILNMLSLGLTDAHVRHGLNAHFLMAAMHSTGLYWWRHGLILVRWPALAESALREVATVHVGVHCPRWRCSLGWAQLSESLGILVCRVVLGHVLLVARGVIISRDALGTEWRVVVYWGRPLAPTESAILMAVLALGGEGVQGIIVIILVVVVLLVGLHVLVIITLFIAEWSQIVCSWNALIKFKESDIKQYENS